MAQRRSWAVGLMLALAVLAAGCGGDDEQDGDATASPGPAQTQAVPRPTPTPTPAGETYVVEQGDTLGSIALEHDTTVEAIVEANDLEDPDTLAIGDELVIPPPEEDPTEEATAEPSPEASPEASPTPGGR